MVLEPQPKLVGVGAAVSTRSDRCGGYSVIGESLPHKHQPGPPAIASQMFCGSAVYMQFVGIITRRARVTASSLADKAAGGCERPRAKQGVTDRMISHDESIEPMLSLRVIRI